MMSGRRFLRFNVPVYIYRAVRAHPTADAARGAFFRINENRKHVSLRVELVSGNNNTVIRAEPGTVTAALALFLVYCNLAPDH